MKWSSKCLPRMEISTDFPLYTNFASWRLLPLPICFSICLEIHIYCVCCPYHILFASQVPVAPFVHMAMFCFGSICGAHGCPKSSLSDLFGYPYPHGPNLVNQRIPLSRESEICWSAVLELWKRWVRSLVGPVLHWICRFWQTIRATMHRHFIVLRLRKPEIDTSKPLKQQWCQTRHSNP